MSEIEIPTFPSSPLSVTEAEELLKAGIDDFFSNQVSKIINYEAGGGKTKCVVVAICDRLITQPLQKIAVFVPTHKLAHQLQDDIKNELIDKRQNALGPRERIQAHTSVRVKHIEGRNERNCRHPLQKPKSYKAPNKSERDLIELFRAHTAQFCRSCPKRQPCHYVSQFNDLHTNVRIYTREELFNPSSLWASGQNWDGSPSEGEWIPDYIIVDEDIVEIAIDKKFVIGTTYSDCDDSTAGQLLKDIIHNSDNETLEWLLNVRSDALVEAYEQQLKAERDWNRKYPIPKVSGNGSPDIVPLFKSRERYEPTLYPIIKHLHEYSLELGKVDDPDELINDAFLFEDSAIKYAGCQSIKSQFSEVPMLLLDATANQIVANAVFNQPFDYMKIPIAYQKNVRVVQFKNKSFARNQLQKIADENGQEIENRDLNNVKAFIGDRGRGKRFGIITYLNLDKEKDFDRKLAESVGAEVYGHFGNIRGLNDFKDLDQLYVVGRQFISSSDLQIKARQIFGGVRQGTRPLSFVTQKARQVLRMSDGVNVAVSQWGFVDDRVQAVDSFINRSETYQAAHRLRLIHGEHPKELFLMTNQVLDITIDELLDSRKIFGHAKPKRDEKIGQVVSAIKEQGIVWDKNTEIMKFTTLSSDDIKNLRRGDKFVSDVLKQDDSIRHEQVSGVDKHGHKVSRMVFKNTAVEVPEEQVKQQLGFSRF